MSEYDEEARRLEILRRHLQLVHKQMHALLGLTAPELNNEALEARLIFLAATEDGPVSLDSSSGEILLDLKQKSKLSVIQSSLLTHLAFRPNVVSDIPQLLSVGWPDTIFRFPEALHYEGKLVGNHIRRIRKSLDVAAPGLSERLEGVPGFGYRWSNPDLRLPQSKL